MAYFHESLLRRPFGLGLAFLVLTGLAATAPAAAAPPAFRPAVEQHWPAARFPLQEVRVEGLKRASEAIVLAEARLEPGATYTEAELRQAIYRVVRLPFVLDAEFRLEKGEERGTYRLLVSVVETRRFFFNREVELVAVGTDLAERVVGSEGFRWLHRGTAGARFFLGKHAELFAAHGLRDTFQVGYTHYDLFGRGVVAGAAAARGAFCCEDRVFSLGLMPAPVRWSLNRPERLTARLAVPLRGAQSLSLSYTTLRSTDAIALRLEGVDPELGPVRLSLDARDLRHHRLDLRWIRDTTDDPVFPTRGLRVDAGGEWQRLDLRGTTSLRELPDPFAQPATRLDLALTPRMVSLSAGVEHNLPVGRRQALSYGGRLAVGRARTGSPLGDDVGQADLSVYGASLHGAHRVELWHHPEPEVGELWWEARAKAAYEGIADDTPFTAHRVANVQVGVSLAFRNAWGLFRLGISYFALEELD